MSTNRNEIATNTLSELEKLPRSEIAQDPRITFDSEQARDIFLSSNRPTNLMVFGFITAKCYNANENVTVTVHGHTLSFDDENSSEGSTIVSAYDFPTRTNFNLKIS